jgi:methyl-accepting chemotaxis protein
MIEESVKNSKNGVDITNEVAKVLTEIVGSVSKTADLVNEIAASSSEQSKGIDQVNTAVAQMDKVTQSNAANAEESATAVEELKVLSENMRKIVRELTELVNGQTMDLKNKKTAGRLRHKNQQLGQDADKSGLDLIPTIQPDTLLTNQVPPKTKEISADEVLPLGDDNKF